MHILCFLAIPNSCQKRSFLFHDKKENLIPSIFEVSNGMKLLY